MRQEQGGDDGRAETFADALADLKRRGSMLLVVGGGDDESLAAACERLRGDDADGRRRLSVLAGSGRTPAEAGGRTVVYPTAARSAAADAGPTAGPAGPDAATVVDGGLADLTAAVEREIEALRPAEGFGSSELRVCLDAADALLASHDRSRVFQFLHALAGQMRETRGMCHVHLPVAFDDEHVQVLAPLFDAIIEVRRGEQQRWHLREPELTTDWLPL